MKLRLEFLVLAMLLTYCKREDNNDAGKPPAPPAPPAVVVPANVKAFAEECAAPKNAEAKVTVEALKKNDKESCMDLGVRLSKTKVLDLSNVDEALRLASLPADPLTPAPQAPAQEPGHYQKLTDISILRHFDHFEVVRLNGNAIADLSPLQSCKNLKELYVAGNPVEKVPEQKTLEKLDISYTNVKDVAFVENLKSLKALYVEKVPVDAKRLQEIASTQNFALVGAMTVPVAPVNDPVNPPVEVYDQRGFNGNKVHRNGTFFDDKGYDFEGFSKSGFNEFGLHRNKTLFDDQGYDVGGRDFYGFDVNGDHKNGTKFDDFGFDVKRFKQNGFNANLDHRNGTKYDDQGYDALGYNADGFNRNGDFRTGGIYDASGRDVNHYDQAGFLADGTHRNGTRFDDTGYDVNRRDARGFNEFGTHANGTSFDAAGFDFYGYNARGWDANGLRRDGSRYDAAGYDVNRRDARGFDVFGFLANGRRFDDTGFDANGRNAQGRTAAEEQARVRQEEERQRLAQVEQDRLRREDEARLRVEEEARRGVIEEARRRAEEAARRAAAGGADDGGESEEARIGKECYIPGANDYQSRDNLRVLNFFPTTPKVQSGVTLDLPGRRIFNKGQFIDAIHSSCRFFARKHRSRPSESIIDTQDRLRGALRTAVVNTMHGGREPEIGRYSMYGVRRDAIVSTYVDTLQNNRLNSSRISFFGETGIDAGGLRKEFYRLFIDQVKSNEIFKKVSDTSSYWYPNPEFANTNICTGSWQALRDKKTCFENVGELFGKLVFVEKDFADIELSNYLRQRIMGVTINDLINLLAITRLDNPDLFKNTMLMLAQDQPNVFVDEFGTELLADNPAITEDNIYIYVWLSLKNNFATLYTEESTGAFIRGFNRMIALPGFDSPHALDLNAYEFDLILRGVTTVTIEQLRPLVRITGGSADTVANTTARWFWEAVTELQAANPSFISQLLIFWTSSRNIPADVGLNPLRLSIQNWRDVHNLPTSHTCFNTIDLSVYPSKQVLKTKLEQAVGGAAGLSD